MKVLLIDVNYKNGSTGKIVYDLHNNLIKEGYQSAICYGRGKKVKEKNVYKFSSTIEVYFHAIMARATGLMGYYSFAATKRLIHYINEYNPDVVHIHELHAYFVNYLTVIRFLKKKNIPTIWTFHCEYMYTGNCGHSYNCDNWKVECGNCPNIKEYPMSLFFDFSRKMIRDKKSAFIGFDGLTIVTPSNWLRNRVKQSFLKDKEIITVYNGIDTESVFYPREFDHLKQKHSISNQKIILTVAPHLFSEQKGGDFIISLAEMMREYNIVFILIGADDEYHQDNVIVLRKTENANQLAEYYTMADITLIASKRETFSLVAVESLACGTPIAGFDTGALSEVIPKEFGAFVDYGDLESLKAAVLRQLHVSDISSKCREFAQLRYSNNVMYQKYKELYLNKSNYHCKEVKKQ